MAAQARSYCLTDPSPLKGSDIPFQLGVASYTFREFSLEESIEMTKQLDIKKLCLKSMHMPLDSAPEEIEEMAGKVRSAGIDLVWRRSDLHG